MLLQYDVKKRNFLSKKNISSPDHIVPSKIF